MKKEFKVKCKNCGKEFTVIEEETKFPIKGDKYFCCRSCSYARHHSEETKQKISNGVKNSEKFHKNNLIAMQNRSKRPLQLNTYYKNINDIPLSICKYCGKQFIQNYELTKYGYKIKSELHFCSNECRKQFKSENFIEINKKYNLGGFKEGSVRNYKSGWYQGIHCDSSWELAFVIYYLDHNINIERCTEKRTYILDNKEYNYYPDFKIDDKIYEIKGIKSKNSLAKQKYNKDVIFLYKNDIKFYINYVINKYGNHFIDLYDKKDKIK